MFYFQVPVQSKTPNVRQGKTPNVRQGKTPNIRIGKTPNIRQTYTPKTPNVRKTGRLITGKSAYKSQSPAAERSLLDMNDVFGFED